MTLLSSALSYQPKSFQTQPHALRQLLATDEILDARQLQNILAHTEGPGGGPVRATALSFVDMFLAQDALVAISECLPHHAETLQQLSFSRCGAHGGGIATTFSNISLCWNLTVVHLANCGLTATHMYSLSNTLLRGCTRLRELDVSGNPLKDEGVHILTMLLAHESCSVQLTSLGLSAVLLTDIIRAVHVLVKIQSLTNVDLSSNPIDTRDPEVRAAMLALDRALRRQWVEARGGAGTSARTILWAPPDASDEPHAQWTTSSAANFHADREISRGDRGSQPRSPSQRSRSGRNQLGHPTAGGVALSDVTRVVHVSRTGPAHGGTPVRDLERRRARESVTGIQTGGGGRLRVTHNDPSPSPAKPYSGIGGRSLSQPYVGTGTANHLSIMSDAGVNRDDPRRSSSVATGSGATTRKSVLPSTTLNSISHRSFSVAANQAAERLGIPLRGFPSHTLPMSGNGPRSARGLSSGGLALSGTEESSVPLSARTTARGSDTQCSLLGGGSVPFSSLYHHVDPYLGGISPSVAEGRSPSSYRMIARKPPVPVFRKSPDPTSNSATKHGKQRTPVPPLQYCFGKRVAKCGAKPSPAFAPLTNRSGDIHRRAACETTDCTLSYAYDDPRDVGYTARHAREHIRRPSAVFRCTAKREFALAPVHSVTPGPGAYYNPEVMTAMKEGPSPVKMISSHAHTFGRSHRLSHMHEVEKVTPGPGAYDLDVF